MREGYWRSMLADGLPTPADASLPDLTAELITMLGSTEATLRDEVALHTLTTWIARGVYDHLLPGLGDGVATGLRSGITQPNEGGDSSHVLRRVASARVLACVLERDHRAALVTMETVLAWGDALLTWLVRENDERGRIGACDLRALCHGGDALAILADSRHMDHLGLTVLLDSVADRVLDRPRDPVAPRWLHAEHDHLAHAVLRVVLRDLVGYEVLDPWVGRMAVVADDSERGGRAQDFLRALHLLLLLTPERPSIRADLLLRLSDALRETHPLSVNFSRVTST